MINADRMISGRREEGGGRRAATRSSSRSCVAVATHDVQSAAAMTHAVAAIGLPFVPAGMPAAVAADDLGSLGPLGHVDPSQRRRPRSPRGYDGRQLLHRAYPTPRESWTGPTRVVGRDGT